MGQRFSLWVVLAGVAAGIVSGYLAGIGMVGSGFRAQPPLNEVRREFGAGYSGDQQREALRAFDVAVRRAGERR